MKKTTAKKATGKKSAAGKSRNNSKPPWLWELTWEDINEGGASVTRYRSEASAKAAMEKEIREFAKDWDCGKGELIREDDSHVTYDGRFMWTLKKVKMH